MNYDTEGKTKINQEKTFERIRFFVETWNEFLIVTIK